MPITSIITKEGVKLRFETTPVEETSEVVVEVRLCDENFMPELGKDLQRYATPDSEEDFHIKLRSEASKVNQLITSHSTHPEWNPEGYVKNYNQDGSN